MIHVWHVVGSQMILFPFPTGVDVIINQKSQDFWGRVVLLVDNNLSLKVIFNGDF
jgi:hypothetical protein